MKITILFLALIALGFSVKAQRMALADNKTHGTTTASASTPIPAKTPQFVFTNYGIDLNHADLKEYPQHFLGDRIARKLYATQKVYGGGQFVGLLPAHADSQRPLWVGIHQQDFLALHCQPNA